MNTLDLSSILNVPFFSPWEPSWATHSSFPGKWMWPNLCLLVHRIRTEEAVCCLEDQPIPRSLRNLSLLSSSWLDGKQCSGDSGSLAQCLCVHEWLGEAATSCLPAIGMWETPEKRKWDIMPLTLLSFLNQLPLPNWRMANLNRLVKRKKFRGTPLNT